LRKILTDLDLSKKERNFKEFFIRTLSRKIRKKVKGIVYACQREDMPLLFEGLKSKATRMKVCGFELFVAFNIQDTKWLWNRDTVMLHEDCIYTFIVE